MVYDNNTTCEYISMSGLISGDSYPSEFICCEICQAYFVRSTLNLQHKVPTIQVLF